MAKPSRKSKSDADAGDDAPLFAGLVDRRAMLRRVLLRRVMPTLLLVAGVITCVAYARSYVDAAVATPKAPPQVSFKNRPAWMTDAVANQLAASLRPAKPRSVFDREVLVETTAKLRANPWIGKINSVRRIYDAAPGDTIEIDCEFRAPMALVRWQDEFYFVDSKGVLLPEKFAPADVAKIMFTPTGWPNIRIIEGVRLPPPAKAGMPWPGEDLFAGLELAGHLYDKTYTEDIIRINVANHGGRLDPREAQIVLVTRHIYKQADGSIVNTEVRWGRPWSSPDNFIEVPPERKMQYMRQLVQELGRVDAKQKWVDIRFDRITHPMPE